MELKELDTKAKLNEPLPKCLYVYEQTYFISCRSLYQQYADKKITLEQAREEKQLILEQYYEHKKQFDFLFSIYRIADKLEQLKEQGFNSVLEWEILEEFNNVINKS